MVAFVCICDDNPYRLIVESRIPDVVVKRGVPNTIPGVAVLLIDSVIQIVGLAAVAVEISLIRVEEHMKIYSRSTKVNVPTNGNKAKELLA